MRRVRTIFFLASVFIARGYWYYPTYFYMPAPFWGEPRLAKDWLHTFDVRLRGGHATRGYNACGCEIPPMDIYGLQNMHAIAKGVPACILQCYPDGYLNTLWQYTPATDCFGKLSFEGKSSLVEFLPTFVQNFCKGFFVGICVPIKKVAFRNLSAVDLTTPESTGAQLQLSDWQQFFCNFDQNLCRYGVNPYAMRARGLGDITLFGGWTINYEGTTELDFLDGTLTMGVHLPTAQGACANAPFVMPLGNDKHYGFSFCATGALGALDWLTIGVQAGVFKLLHAQRMVAIKTAAEQSGWIKLARTEADVRPGVQWRIGEFLKFDHLVYGLSLTFGFSSTHQHATCLRACNVMEYDHPVVNSDSQLAPWTMHAFHCVIECDFATFKHPCVPRLAFTVDRSFAGKRVVNTSLFGMILAADF